MDEATLIARPLTKLTRSRIRDIGLAKCGCKAYDGFYITFYHQHHHKGTLTSHRVVTWIPDHRTEMIEFTFETDKSHVCVHLRHA